MKRFCSYLPILFLSFGLHAGPAHSQGGPACDRFDRTREGNILQGICYARSGHVHGSREQINLTCEQLILCGGPNDLGDCHLARNVCKGLVDPACNHGELDVFNGPFALWPGLHRLRNQGGLAGVPERVRQRFPLPRLDLRQAGDPGSGRALLAEERRA